MKEYTAEALRAAFVAGEIISGEAVHCDGYLDLRSLKSIPDGVTLHAGGYLYLGRLTSLPEGVTLHAGGSLDLGGLTSIPDGVTLSAGGYLDLHSLTSIPDGVTLHAGCQIDLGGLTSLPEGVTLHAGGSLYLGGLTSLPEGVTLHAGGHLDLGGLTSIADGVTLSAGGSLDLGSLTSIPDGVTLSASGYLDLGSLTSIPDGVTLSAGGSLYLGSLTDEVQQYKGKAIRLRTIDGFCMRLISKKNVAGAELWKAQYFKGNLDTDPNCFVASMDGYNAHGNTAERALRDLRFKIAQVNFDAEELVATIKARGTVTFNDYRLITGACSEGLRQGLIDRGVDPDVEELPLDTVLKLSKGGYGGDGFAKALEEN